MALIELTLPQDTKLAVGPNPESIRPVQPRDRFQVLPTENQTARQANYLMLRSMQSPDEGQTLYLALPGFFETLKGFNRQFPRLTTSPSTSAELGLAAELETAAFFLELQAINEDQRALAAEAQTRIASYSLY